MVDHRSYTHNLSNCEIKALKKFTYLNYGERYEFMVDMVICILHFLLTSFHRQRP